MLYVKRQFRTGQSGHMSWSWKSRGGSPWQMKIWRATSRKITESQNQCITVKTIHNMLILQKPPYHQIHHLLPPQMCYLYIRKGLWQEPMVNLHQQVRWLRPTFLHLRQQYLLTFLTDPLCSPCLCLGLHLHHFLALDIFPHLHNHNHHLSLISLSEGHNSGLRWYGMGWG